MEIPEFKDWTKIFRLSRNVKVTEKLDGTNSQVYIFQELTSNVPELLSKPEVIAHQELGATSLFMLAGSRNRWIYPSNDNFGFAAWVKQNSEELFNLGAGSHFGEWWGAGIQRRYNLKEKKFSLFNVSRWSDPTVRPKCCEVVPTLYDGVFDTTKVDEVLESLRINGSVAAPGFSSPEGIIIFHEPSGFLFKKTLNGDGHKGTK